MAPTCTKPFAPKVPPRHHDHGPHGSPGHPRHGGHPGAPPAAKPPGLGTARPRWHRAGVQHQPGGVPESLHPLSSRRTPKTLGSAPIPLKNSPQNSTTPHRGTARGGRGWGTLSCRAMSGATGMRRMERSETKKRQLSAAGMPLECRWNAGRGEDGWQGDRDTRGREAAGEVRLAASCAYLLVQIF